MHSQFDPILNRVNMIQIQQYLRFIKMREVSTLYSTSFFQMQALYLFSFDL